MSLQSNKAKSAFFEKASIEGWNIIGEYQGNNTPVHMICPDGHDCHMRPTPFVRSPKCRACAGQCPIQAEKGFRSDAAYRGYKVLGKYTKNREPIAMVCPEGHHIKMAPNYFKTKLSRCKQCSGRCPDTARKKFEKARAELESEGWEFNSSYKNSTTKVHIKCPSEHGLLLLPSQVMRKGLCNKCLGRTHEEAASSFYSNVQRRGYRLEGEYVKSNIKVKAVCDKDHPIYLLPATFNAGTGCRICAGQCTELAREKYFESAVMHGYEILSGHVNSITKVKMKCPEGHVISMRPSNFMSGKRCGDCHPGGFDSNKKGYVYLLQSSCKRYVKCGISNVPVQRILNLTNTTPFKFKQIRLFEFKSGRMACDSETAVARLNWELRPFVSLPIHEQFDGYTEWYELDSKSIRRIVALCVKHGGMLKTIK